MHLTRSSAVLSNHCCISSLESFLKTDHFLLVIFSKPVILTLELDLDSITVNHTYTYYSILLRKYYSSPAEDTLASRLSKRVFKLVLCIIVHQPLARQTPSYLASGIQLTTNTGRPQLRSASERICVVPHTQQLQ